MPTVMYGDFEWDEEKNTFNAGKHGLRFEEIISLFAQDRYVSPPIEHSSGETRYLTVGLYAGKEVTVVYTQRDGHRRIISARRAHYEERVIYRDTVRT